MNKKNMPVEKKLIIIAIISFVLTMIAYFIDSDLPNPNIFKTIFEIGMMTGLTFIIIAINFFAISFCIKKAREFFKK